jgi:hypothetical protein
VTIFAPESSYGEAIGSYRGDPVYHASLDAAEYKDLLVRSGFELVEHAATDQRAGRRSIWLARLAAG